MSQETPSEGATGEIREWYITSPVSDEEVAKLRAGDMVYISGLVHTARDGVYNHMLVKGNRPPIDLATECNVSFQSSPAGVEVASGEYRVSSFQATAGFRYAQYMPRLLEEHGIKIVVGKAGMSEQVYRDVFMVHHAACLSTVGYGLGAIYGRCIKGVRAVYWKDVLGISEALWVLEVVNMGPLLVEGDVHGNSFFSEVNQEINRNLDALYRDLREPVFHRLGETESPQREMFR